MKNQILRTTLALVMGAAAIGQVAPRQPRGGGITGVVRFPDGTPTEGATVTATTDCKEMGYNLFLEVKSSADGSFYIPLFAQAACNRVQLSAEKVEDLWLKTGHDVFYGGDNGTAPVVESSAYAPPTVTEIRLGDRGASVSLRVWDTSTERFISAELYIKRIPVPGKTFGSIQFVTRKDGSPATLLLPAGRYQIFVEYYSCGGLNYPALNPSRETFEVEAGQRLAKDISVDGFIKPAKSHGNPHAMPCNPGK